jgi:adenosylcobinamide kinase/adenosylcobinamide-phosphate guanylyltransferase
MGAEVLFVATAQAFDEEMEQRIERHQRQRPSHWQTVEAPMKVAEVVGSDLPPVVLVDCLTLLVSNLILTLGDNLDEVEAETAVAEELDALLALMQSSRSQWIVISNEVGWGIVPNNKLSRIYRDVLGRANQRLAAAAGKVILMVAGIPMTVKDNG